MTVRFQKILSAEEFLGKRVINKFMLTKTLLNGTPTHFYLNEVEADHLFSQMANLFPEFAQTKLDDLSQKENDYESI